MTRTGSNMPAVGHYNRAVVLDAIRHAPGGLSRVDIAVSTALSAQTVSNVCKVLVEQGLVRPTGTRVGGPGKPPLILELDPDGAFAVGVELEDSTGLGAANCVLVDLTGSVRARTADTARWPQDFNSAAGRIAASIDELVSLSGIDRSRIEGIGLATPAPIGGLPREAPAPSRSEQLRAGLPIDELCRALRDVTRLPVHAERDAAAAAVAELWARSSDERRNFVYLYYGARLSTGIAVGGEMLRGSSSNAGGIEHLTVDPEGQHCPCGRRGCVGVVVAPRSIVATALARGLLPPGVSGAEIEAKEVDRLFTTLSSLAKAGDEEARALIVEAATFLAHAVVMILNLLDVDEVIFGGPFWSRIAESALTVLPAVVVEDPALVLQHDVRFAESSMVEHGAAVGAAAIVLDEMYSARPGDYLLMPGTEPYAAVATDRTRGSRPVSKGRPLPAADRESGTPRR